MTNTITVLKKKAAGKNGFTLVELVIVIAILAILAAIAIPTVSHLIAQANTSADASDAGTLTMAFKTTAAEVSAKGIAVDEVDTVAEVLTHNGMQVTILRPKTDGNAYFFNNDLNKAVCSDTAANAVKAGGGAETDWEKLTPGGTDTVTYGNGKVTIGKASNP